MPKGVVRYKVDIIYKPTGEVVFLDTTMKYASEILGVTAKTLRRRMAQSKEKVVTVGNYEVVQRDYTMPTPVKHVYHESLDNIVKEFLRVCREPKLWAGIREEYLGEYAERFKGC